MHPSLLLGSRVGPLARVLVAVPGLLSVGPAGAARIVEVVPAAGVVVATGGFPRGVVILVAVGPIAVSAIFVSLTISARVGALSLGAHDDRAVVRQLRILYLSWMSGGKRFAPVGELMSFYRARLKSAFRRIVEDGA